MARSLFRAASGCTRGGMEKRAVCPICERPAVADHAPFCSQGCRDRDLIAWLDERRSVPADPVTDED